MNHFFAYMLKCVDGSYYVGHTDNLEQRISQHMSGKIDSYTAQRLPVKVVWIAIFDTREAAFLAERKIKDWSRKKKEALIKKDWESISKFASRKKRLVSFETPA